MGLASGATVVAFGAAISLRAPAPVLPVGAAVPASGGESPVGIEASLPVGSGVARPPGILAAREAAVMPEAAGMAEPAVVRRPLAPPERVLAGRFVDVDGNPVPNAHFWVWPDPHTDASGNPRGPTVESSSGLDGRFVAMGVAEGPLGVTLAGWPTWSDRYVRRLGVPAGNLEVVVGSPKTIAGRVVDADTGAPIPCFEIVGYLGWRVCGNAPASLRMEVLSSSGSFDAVGLKSDTNDLQFRAFGYAEETLETDGIRTAGSRAVVVRMHRAVTVRGSVLHRLTGLPMAGQGIHLAFDGGGRSLQSLGSTKGDGAFEVTGIRPGPFRLSAGDGLFSGSESGPLAGRPGETIEGVLIRHSESGAIEGIARAEALPEVRASNVSLRRAEESEGRVHVSPDAEGRFRFPGVRPGDYVVEIAFLPGVLGGSQSSGFRYVAARAHVEGGKATTVVFRDPPLVRKD